MRNANLRGMSVPLFSAEELEHLYGEQELPQRDNRDREIDMPSTAMCFLFSIFLCACGGGMLYGGWRIVAACLKGLGL